MKKLSARQALLFAATLIAVALCIVVLCQSTFSIHSLSTQSDGSFLYEKAVQEIQNRSEISYSVQTEKRVITEDNTYTELHKQDIGYIDSGNGSFQLSSVDTISVGDYVINAFCQYQNGTAYLSLNSSGFSAALSPHELQKQYTPAILLDPDNYNTVQAYRINTGTVIFFSSPKALEFWTKENKINLQQASGIAILNKKGALTESFYCTTAKSGDVTIETAVIVKPTNQSVELAEINKENYIPVNSLNAPLALELACGYLLQSSNFSSNATDTITCDAFGDRFVQDIALNYSGTGADFSASLNTSLLLQNSSRGGEITETLQTVAFSDGICTVTANNTPPVEDHSVTQEAMLKYCQDILIGSVLLPQDIRTAKFTENKNYYRYDFTVTEEMANRISQKACLTLYNEEAFLQKLSSDYTSDGVKAYIILDNKTLVPIASGILYTGTYVIDDFPYKLSYTAEQTYN